METPKHVELDVTDVDDIEDGEKESYLVGRLVTEKHWNPSNLIQVIKKVWEPKHGVSSRAWEESKLILFRFDDVMDRDWVLKNQPWRFKGSLFAIKKFTGENEQQLSSLDNVTVEHASFWVRLYDVPFSCRNERTLWLFAKRIGILECVDASGEDLIGKFIRFKISINITKPLLRGITIRVEGEHLWLPLKYESLPTYCFFCGTIGHDYNECRSYNRGKLEYSTLEVKEKEIEQEQNDTSAATIPYDIVENILSRVPAKYLIRYKLVCKQWEATISDPSFAEMHLQHFKNSSPRNLIAQEQCFVYYKGVHVAKVLYNSFRFVSEIEHSRKYRCNTDCEILCNCDGLYLKSFHTTPHKGKAYLLWNPSCRSYKEIWCPRPIDDTKNETICCGVYYNPLMKDYKVVMTDQKHYAVFSCRYNKWSEVKEIKDHISYKNSSWGHRGVSFNGSIYWLTFSDVLICFDGGVEKFKKFPTPDYFNEDAHDFADLASSGDYLYLFSARTIRGEPPYCSEMSMWKKVNGDNETNLWVEHKVLQLRPNLLYWPSSICWLSECEVILRTNSTNKTLLYDNRKHTLEVIASERYSEWNHPVVYLENLFLQ